MFGRSQYHFSIMTLGCFFFLYQSAFDDPVDLDNDSIVVRLRCFFALKRIKLLTLAPDGAFTLTNVVQSLLKSEISF